MPLKEIKKIRVDYDDPKLDQQGVDYFEYDGKPFNGYRITGYFTTADNASQEISDEDEFRDGFRMGWRREYYPNGNVKEEHLDFFDTPMLTIEYNNQGVETRRFSTISQDDYDDLIAKYNILDK